MNISRLMFLGVCTLVCQQTLAINWDKVPTISVGIEGGFKSLSVIEQSTDNDQLAQMTRGLSLFPSVVISSNETYIWDDQNWGYNVQVNGGWYSMDKQQVNEQATQLGTHVKGFSIYAVPVGYYHFNKGVVDDWTYKLGLGVGLGWVNLDGDTQLTKTNHPLSGQTISIDTSGFGTAIGIYFEAKYKSHSIVLQNNAPQISDSDFYYQQNNIAIAYRYQIDKDWIRDIIEGL